MNINEVSFVGLVVALYPNIVVLFKDLDGCLKFNLVPAILMAK